jgi:hypothetical protein
LGEFDDATIRLDVNIARWFLQYQDFDFDPIIAAGTVDSDDSCAAFAKVEYARGE